jgi:hypothetical protein
VFNVDEIESRGCEMPRREESGGWRKSLKDLASKARMNLH